jgi:hypothetical protein
MLTQIDLHGKRHSWIEDELLNIVILHYNEGSFPIKLITGHSLKMKEIVRKSLVGSTNRFNVVEDMSNSGCLIVRER